jgi:aerobic carbon-monoxide dehydrogenase large subunit
VFTNTVPVDSYRGAGRPEATYVLERLIDHAAACLGIDPVELRARNLPEAQGESLTSVTGLVIEGGRFLYNQRRCLELADRAGFAERRRGSSKRGLLRGFGFANYLEANGGLAVAKMIEPDHLPVESVFMTFGANGSLEIVVGTQSTGQDHATAMVAHAARMLGLPPERVVVRQGDSDALGRGGGTGGSKSLLTSSVALEQGLSDVVARGGAGSWLVSGQGIHRSFSSTPGCFPCPAPTGL